LTPNSIHHVCTWQAEPAATSSALHSFLISMYKLSCMAHSGAAMQAQGIRAYDLICPSHQIHPHQGRYAPSWQRHQLCPHKGHAKVSFCSPAIACSNNNNKHYFAAESIPPLPVVVSLEGTLTEDHCMPFVPQTLGSQPCSCSNKSPQLSHLCDLATKRKLLSTPQARSWQHLNCWA
jgi:hypothetical protein